MGWIVFAGSGDDSTISVLSGGATVVRHTATLTGGAEIVSTTAIESTLYGYNPKHGTISNYDKSRRTAQYRYFREPVAGIQLMEEFPSAQHIDSGFSEPKTYGLPIIQLWQRTATDELNRQVAILDPESCAVHVYEIGVFASDNKKLISVHDARLRSAVDVAIDGGRVDVLLSHDAWLYSFQVDGSPLTPLLGFFRGGALLTENQAPLLRGGALLGEHSLFSGLARLVTPATVLQGGATVEPFFATWKTENDENRRWLASIDVLDGTMVLTECTVMGNLTQGSEFRVSVLNRADMTGSTVDILGYNRTRADKALWTDTVAEYDRLNSLFLDNPLGGEFGPNTLPAKNTILNINKSTWNSVAVTNFAHYEIILRKLNGEKRIFFHIMGRARFINEVDSNGIITTLGNEDLNNYYAINFETSLSLDDTRLICEFRESSGLAATGMKCMPRGVVFTENSDEVRGDFYRAVDADSFLDTIGAIFDKTLETWTAGLYVQPIYGETVEDRPLMLGTFPQAALDEAQFRGGADINIGCSVLHGGVVSAKRGIALSLSGGAVISTAMLNQLMGGASVYYSGILSGGAVVTTRQAEILTTTFVITRSGNKVWRVDFDSVGYAVSFMGAFPQYGLASGRRTPILQGKFLYTIEADLSSVKKFDLLTGAELGDYPFPNTVGPVKNLFHRPDFQRLTSPLIVVNQSLYYFCELDTHPYGRGMVKIFRIGEDGYRIYKFSEILQETTGDYNILDMRSNGVQTVIIAEALDDPDLYLYVFDEFFQVINKSTITGAAFTRLASPNGTPYLDYRNIRIVAVDWAGETCVLGCDPSRLASVTSVSFNGESVWHGYYGQTGLIPVETGFLGLGTGNYDWFYRGLDALPEYGSDNGADRIWHEPRNIPLSVVDVSGRRVVQFYAPMEDKTAYFRNGEEPPVYVPDPLKDPAGTLGGDPHLDMFGTRLTDGAYQPVIAGVFTIGRYLSGGANIYRGAIDDPGTPEDITGFGSWGVYQKL